MSTDNKGDLKCENCFWFTRTTRPAQTLGDLKRLREGQPVYGFCRRRAPFSDTRFPEVRHNEFCGDFKIKED